MAPGWWLIIVALVATPLRLLAAKRAIDAREAGNENLATRYWLFGGVHHRTALMVFELSAGAVILALGIALVVLHR